MLFSLMHTAGKEQEMSQDVHRASSERVALCHYHLVVDEVASRYKLTVSVCMENSEARSCRA